MEALIANIQHFNMFDGNGLRTIVFFQGCNLRCKWCQNPEMISKQATMVYDKKLCVSCGACIDICKSGALRLLDGKIHFSVNDCNQCKKCETECYYLARRFSSRILSLEQVYNEVVKDKCFYGEDGGVTLSGGEPLLSAEFVRALCKQLKNSSINVVLETAGFVPWKSIQNCLMYIDTFFYDLKLISEEKRKLYLGTTSDLMLDNLRKLAKTSAHIVIRIPLIPNVNDTDEEFLKMMEFIEGLGTVKNIHILPFHQMGAAKYEMVGMPYDFLEVSVQDEVRVEKCLKLAQQYGFCVTVGGDSYYEFGK